jgi:hypothetical protein
MWIFLCYWLLIVLLLLVLWRYNNNQSGYAKGIPHYRVVVPRNNQGEENVIYEIKLVCMYPDKVVMEVENAGHVIQVPCRYRFLLPGIMDVHNDQHVVWYENVQVLYHRHYIHAVMMEEDVRIVYAAAKEAGVKNVWVMVKEPMDVKRINEAHRELGSGLYVTVMDPYEYCIEYGPELRLSLEGIAEARKTMTLKQLEDYEMVVTLSCTPEVISDSFEEVTLSDEVTKWGK